jgi:hypothetical protein
MRQVLLMTAMLAQKFRHILVAIPCGHTLWPYLVAIPCGLVQRRMAAVIVSGIELMKRSCAVDI